MLYTIWFSLGEDRISPHFFFKNNVVNIFLLEYLFINLHID